MSTKKYRVIADFYDKNTGELIETSSLYSADTKRAEELKSAGVIGEVVAEKEKKQGTGDKDETEKGGES